MMKCAKCGKEATNPQHLETSAWDETICGKCHDELLSLHTKWLKGSVK